MEKRTIHVLFDNTPYTLTWLRSLVWARTHFLDHNVIIDWNGVQPCYGGLNTRHILQDKEYYKRIFSNQYDIVFLAYKHTRGLCNLHREEREELLSTLRRNSNVLVWLDTADSTGTCMFDVLPYVDYYLKKQLLVDLSQYKHPVWGERIWCEYYHKLLAIADNDINRREQVLLTDEYLCKLGLSWNVGIGDLFTRGFAKKLFRKSYAPLQYSPPSFNRDYDIQYRGTTSESSALIQRNLIIDHLDKRQGIKIPGYRDKVPLRQYMKEARSARCILSPFGWGEICTRDFEAFVYGAAMIKPDMEHLITYPHFYKKDYTYVSINWDFSNFDRIIDDIISHENDQFYYDIACNGQKVYKDFMSEFGKEQFVCHVLNEIGL